MLQNLIEDACSKGLLLQVGQDIPCAGKSYQHVNSSIILGLKQSRGHEQTWMNCCNCNLCACKPAQNSCAFEYPEEFIQIILSRALNLHRWRWHSEHEGTEGRRLVS